ncbi:MAG: ZIP family metal transporter, partial [Dehalococcoidia bacterium]
MVALVFAFISALAAIFGGLLPIYTRLRELGPRYLIGFAAGVMLTVAFLEMIPEMIEEANEASVVFLAVGFFSLYLVEKLVMIHGCPEGECEIDTHTHIGWVSLIGIAAESLLDGIAIAIGFSLEPTLGITIAVAVIVHEVPRGFTTVVIMKGAGYERGKVFAALGVDSLATPLGAGLVLLGLFPSGWFPFLLAFAAGTFIYVGA